MSTARTNTTSTATAPAGRPKVMVVDDDPDLRVLACMQLGDGYEVLPCDDARRALAMAAECAPDVILLDMMMPGMDGPEVLGALAADPRTQDIPVIFLSALSAVQNKVDALNGGAVDYIIKPADPRELSARIGAAARTRARQERLGDSSIDPITKLPTKRRLQNRLDEEIGRAKRSRTRFSILLFDVDGMAVHNEQQGEAGGDVLLLEIGHMLRRILRSSDLLFSYGSDEFCALLPDADIGTAYRAAERARYGAVAIHSDRPISLSVGVAEFSGAGSPTDLLAKAKLALFRAKDSGGNRSWRADDLRRSGLGATALSKDLTQREWDVLAHLAQRKTEHEIARRLGISAGTVRSHKARIRRKLHVAPDVRLAEFVSHNFKDFPDRTAHAGDADRVTV